LRRFGSGNSINSNASGLSILSASSHKKHTRTASAGTGFIHDNVPGVHSTTHDLQQKLAEMNSYKQILSRQIDTLQNHFDSFATIMENLNKTQDTTEHSNQQLEQQSKNEKGEDSSSSSITNDVKNNIKSMKSDFKAEALTFKATTTGVIYDLSFCIDLMQKEKESWKKKFEEVKLIFLLYTLIVFLVFILKKEVEKRRMLYKKYKELRETNMKSLNTNGPDFEEGAHSLIKEDEFFDAIDNTLDALEFEEERVLK
jgi:collagen type IV alpha-3-binding protein